jgi:hypothetical protein
MSVSINLSIFWSLPKGNNGVSRFPAKVWVVEILDLTDKGLAKNHSFV